MTNKYTMIAACTALVLFGCKAAEPAASFRTSQEAVNGVSVTLSPDACFASVLFDELILESGNDGTVKTIQIPLMKAGKKADISVDVRGSFIGRGHGVIALSYGGQETTLFEGPSKEIGGIYNTLLHIQAIHKNFKDLSVQIKLTPDQMQSTDMSALLSLDSLDFTLSGCGSAD